MFEVPPSTYHQPIPHDPDDQSPIIRQEGHISFYEKQIVALHNLMRAKKQLPSFDSVRRAAEEVDGQFAAQAFSDEIPDFLKHRLPDYGERRVLAVERVLQDLNYVSREELKQSFTALDDTDACQFPAKVAYQPETNEATYAIPQYQVGDLVQVIPHDKVGHIRTPVYLRQKKGIIQGLQGQYLNPEELAHFKSPVFRLPLYLVEFEMLEVWGDRCPIKSLKDKLRVEIYEPWLSPLP